MAVEIRDEASKTQPGATRPATAPPLRWYEIALIAWYVTTGIAAIYQCLSHWPFM